MRDDLKDAITLFYKESRMKTAKASHKHMILIPDKNIQHLPWESISILRGHSVSRMPSLEMLSQYLALEQTVDQDSVFYLLNPSGDLTRTEKNFKGVLKESKGISGRVPTKDEFLNGLNQSQIFLYFGHGGGENYIDVFSIEKLSTVPILLLFGCSSGRLKPCGDFDPHGISLEYLAAGSLGVLGNLWDVTDIDIDRFSDDLMTRWGLFNSATANRSTLPESCAKAREACNLKFIVGAAPVFYGIRPQFR
jgi:separase